DIKCSNILLHSPPGSGIVYVKISDFGLAKKEEEDGKTQFVGTLPHMAPELFLEPAKSSQAVDIYALGITFYRLVTHKYPVHEKKFKDQRQKITHMTSIDRPEDIKDDVLWDLLTQMLNFDPGKRITAELALKHEFFTGHKANDDISPQQRQLAEKATQLEINGDRSINEYDKEPTFIVEELVIKKFLLRDIKHRQQPLQIDEKEEEKEEEEFQTEK
ncbi:MAG: hypothetical protein EZS28_007188, partial [Streblomastix strix]